jgi:hypothetical protein
MSKCKVCGVPADTRCGFCGGQGCKTFLCDNHRHFIVSVSGNVEPACGKCKDKKTTKGLWKVWQLEATK